MGEAFCAGHEGFALVVGEVELFEYLPDRRHEGLRAGCGVGWPGTEGGEERGGSGAVPAGEPVPHEVVRVEGAGAAGGDRPGGPF
ncbi:hypothetical protein ACH4F6_30275 [Streptomyces sp. NPDC017936]|uniref:hypothetical protein n=1 Tax=Streptomyces sp. NPDC017936 TaxID=3365016 RepID=UPI00379B08E2